MRQIPPSNWKAIELDTCQRVQMDQGTTQHAMWDIYALICTSKVQGKYKIYLKYYHICTECFLVHIEIEVIVVKSKVWALKNLQTECKGNSMNTRNWRMYLNVQTEMPWSPWKLTGKLHYAILKNPQATDVDFGISWTTKANPANPLFWSGIWFKFRIQLYLEQSGLFHTVKCTLHMQYFCVLADLVLLMRGWITGNILVFHTLLSLEKSCELYFLSLTAK